MTPKSSAAPLAVRPGSSSTVPHSRPATSATRPGPIPRTIRPRRMPTERHTDPRSRRRRRARSAEPQRGSGTGRASCTPDCTRSSSRGGSPSAQAAGRAPSTSPVTVEQEERPEGQRPAPGLRGVREPRGGERPGERREESGEVERGEDDDDRTGADAYDEHAASGASYTLHGPAGCLPERGGGEDPGQHDQLGADEVPGRRHQSRDGEEGPRLHHPGEVDRGEQQRTEVLGDGTDRVDGRLAPRQQLAAAAAAHGGADRQQQEAGEGGAEVALEGGERPLERGRAARPQVDPRGHHGEDRGQHDHRRPGRGRRHRDGVRSAHGTPSGDGCRAPPPARPAARCQSRRAR